jgi:AcrR family transcriptional regulator
MAEVATGGRELRADARRNLERILEAAGEVFAEQGVDAGVADIARRAGVGTATIFRRFATKDDLVEAIFEARLRTLVDEASVAAEDPDAFAGLRRFVEATVRMQCQDRGFLEANATHHFADPRSRELRDEIVATLDGIVERAREAGQLRPDFGTTDLPPLLHGLARSAAFVEPIGGELWRRYVGIVLDGLRPGGETLAGDAPTLEQIDEALGAVGGPR